MVFGTVGVDESAFNGGDTDAVRYSYESDRGCIFRGCRILKGR